MADVVSAFLSGRQAALAEQAHKDALEQNKLRAMVLKHQMDALKIEDQLRTRDLARQNFELLHGQPAADLPSETVTQPQQIPARQGLAGLIPGLPSESPNGVPAAPTPPTAGPMATPEQFTTTGSRPRMFDIPGVPGLNVPGVSVRPQSLEDLTQRAILAQLQKAAFTPQRVGEGQKVVLNGQTIAEGGPR